MRGCAALFKNYQFSLLALFAMILTMLLVSCGGGGGGYVSENRSNRGYNPGVGPFDSQGNYVERWANDKSKGRWWRKSIVTGSSATTPAIASTTTPSPAAQPPGPKPTTPVGRSSTSTPSPTVASAPKPKPKPVKVTPKPIRHTVKKGDTLWAISRKYGTTVTAIQRANGIKGTNLKIGRTLLIPRY